MPKNTSLAHFSFHGVTWDPVLVNRTHTEKGQISRAIRRGKHENGGGDKCSFSHEQSCLKQEKWWEEAEQGHNVAGGTRFLPQCELANTCNWRQWRGEQKTLLCGKARRRSRKVQVYSKAGVPAQIPSIPKIPPLLWSPENLNTFGAGTRGCDRPHQEKTCLKVFKVLRGSCSTSPVL